MPEYTESVWIEIEVSECVSSAQKVELRDAVIKQLEDLPQVEAVSRYDHSKGKRTWSIDQKDD